MPNYLTAHCLHASVTPAPLYHSPSSPLSHCPIVSQPLYVSVLVSHCPLCNCHIVSQPNRPTAQLFHCPSVSLPHCVTAPLCHYPIISPSHYPFSHCPMSQCPTLIAYCLTNQLSHSTLPHCRTAWQISVSLSLLLSFINIYAEQNEVFKLLKKVALCHML